MIKYFIYLTAVLSIIACSHRITPSTTPYTNTEVQDNGETILIGHCSLHMLQKENYKQWYNFSFNSYRIDSATTNQLKPLLKNKTMQIFLGSWCDDSKREVPRMLKILNYAGFDTTHIQLICVNHAKQSPQHEEQGKHITNVPTFIIYNHKKEMGRIIESPKLSLEKDLLTILQSRNNHTKKIAQSL